MPRTYTHVCTHKAHNRDLNFVYRKQVLYCNFLCLYQYKISEQPKILLIVARELTTCLIPRYELGNAALAQ